MATPARAPPPASRGRTAPRRPPRAALAPAPSGGKAHVRPAPRRAPPAPRTADVLVACSDAKGVVAALSQLFYGYGCNVLESDQHTTEAGEDGSPPRFYQRLSVDLTDLHQGDDTTALEAALAATAERFDMSVTMHKKEIKKRVAVLVSRSTHNLWDLLIKHASGELDCELVLVAGNHAEPGGEVAAKFGVPFHHLPIDASAHGGDNEAAKAAQEKALRRLLKEEAVDVVVLARYMQVLSADFCRDYAGRVINIHHSFLPAFEGGRPYHRAHERGVKLIGATAHFVSADLDAGPIISQNVVPVSHRDSVEDLVRKGADLERLTLSRALRLHLQNRVLLHDNKTIVYD